MIKPASRAWQFFGDICLFVAAALGGWVVLTALGIHYHSIGACQ